MTRGRLTRTLVLAVGIVGAAYALVTPVHTQGPGSGQGLQIGLHRGHEVVAGEVLVKVRPEARFAPFGQDLDVDRDEQIGDGSVRRIHSRSHNVETLLAKLADLEEVEYAEPNYIVYALETTPNDPSFGSLWGLRKIGAPLAWDRTTGSADNVVGVIDTGVDYNHPDLAASVWSAPSSFTVDLGSRTITCPAGSHGFNAIKYTCDPMDDNNHGTHVSGTIGADGNNGVGVVGVNWTTSIMGLKFLGASGSGSTSDAVNAIEFAIQAKNIFPAAANVTVLSNSWGGGGFSQSLLDKIIDARSAGILFVAAAGNNSSNNDVTPHYPASYSADNVIAVAATDSNDALPSWSNYGLTSVDLAAPGVSIYSTVRNGRYGTMSGTSMATPHVSGAAALILSAVACNGLNSAGVKNLILNNVDPVSSLAGKAVTGGRLNVARAIAGCSGGSQPQADFSISASPGSRSVRRGQTATYTITVVPANGFHEYVDLTVPSPPPAVDPDLIPSTVTGGSGSVTLTASSSSKGTYTITVVGTNGSLTRSVNVMLKVR